MDFQLLTRSLRLFMTWFITDTTVNVASIAAMLLIAERFDGIGAWSKPQLLFMLGYATLVNGVLDTFFGYNVLFISRRLGRGQLDHTLIQPQPLWLSLLTEGFMPIEGIGTVSIGSGLMAWGLSHLPVTLSFNWFVLLLVNLTGSVAVVLAFSFTVGSLAFWAPRAAEEISTPLIRMFYHLKQFPFDGLSPLVLGPLMQGGGQWLTLIALYGGNRAVVYTERHFDAARVLDLGVSEHATTIGIIGDAMARPLAEAVLAEPERWDCSEIIGGEENDRKPRVGEELLESP